MIKYLSLDNISITKKLSLGFGLLIILSIVLSLTSFHALIHSEKSLSRISRLGAIFDETVTIRENNYEWMMEHKDNALELHDKAMNTIHLKLKALLTDIDAGTWPAEDKETILQVIVALNDYQVRHNLALAQGANQQTLSELNDQMGNLQDSINSIYLKIEQRAASNQDVNHMRLLIITLLVIAIGLVAAYVISVQITRPLKQVLRVTRQIAEGDLTAEITSERRDEMGRLIVNMMKMKDNLHGMVDKIRLSAECILNVTDGILVANTDLSARTEQQAAAIEETAASMEQLTATVNQSAENAHFASKQSTTASDRAQHGGDIVANVVQTMNSISDSSQKIAEITNVIDSIALQTNILALNAAVEAARAGEQGRGFAVVAGEVRNLAQRSAEAAKQIDALISESSVLVNNGSMQVNNAGQTMAEVVRAITDVTTVMGEIATASDEQNQGINQVGQAIIEMETVTQKNASLVQSAAVEFATLKEQSDLLSQAIADFRLSKEQVRHYSATSERHRQKTPELLSDNSAFSL